MRFRWPKADCITVEITGASPTDFINVFYKLGVSVHEVEMIDDFTISVQMNQVCFDYVCREIERRGGTCKLVKPSLCAKIILHLRKRTLLTIGIVALLFGVLYLPSRILLVRITGNASVPTNLIVDKAYACGIRFGANRKEVRSEEIKNALIAEIPELQWVGVNTDGCVALISVREKSGTDAINENTGIVSNIVAKRDGLIISNTVLRGTALCEAGQAVVCGQILVSGYSDCGICIQATQAEAEVLAQTKHDLNIISPVSNLKRKEITGETTRFRLMIGKNLINLYNDSGISDSTCVKIYEENYLSLPNGFVLPVCLITEHTYNYEMHDANQNPNDETFDWLETYANTYLQDKMIAGQILSFDGATSTGSGFAHYSGQYDCIEMIGQTKVEENIIEYGFND